MDMKSFIKPDYEIVRFGSNIVTGSPCICWDGDIDWGPGVNCKGDNPQCTCRPNYDPNVGNCTDPY